MQEGGTFLLFPQIYVAFAERGGYNAVGVRLKSVLMERWNYAVYSDSPPQRG